MSDATLTISQTENVIQPQTAVNGHDPSSLISMRDIWKTYQMGTEKVHALHGVSFDIPRGEYIAIIGPSGSGKSTLMNLIGCLDTPSQGEYWLNGKNVSEMDDDELARIRNQEVGFVFQTFNLLARATALHNVELPLIYGGVSSSQRHEMAKQALKSVDLTERMMHKPNELSGGQRQRVAIARALVRGPRLLLCDEPTGNLDRVAADNVASVLLELHKLKQTILIVVTHSAALAEKLPARFNLIDAHLERS